MEDIKWIKLLLSVIALTIIVVVLRELKAIFLPLVFAIFLSFIFAPINNALTKRHIPKFVTIIILLMLILIFFGVVAGILYISVNSLITELPKYQDKMIILVNDSYADIQEHLRKLDNVFANIPSWFDKSQLLSPGRFSITQFLTGTMGTFFDVMVKLFLTLIFLMFIVAGANKLEARIRNVLTETRNKQTLFLMHSISEQMKKYFLHKTLISLGTASTSMLFVWIFKIDFIVITGVLIFILNYIPNIGSIVASFFPILICFLQYGFSWQLIAISSMMVIIQTVFGNIIEPNVMGERLNLSPIVVLISLIFWGWVWGTTGMILAIPITSAINIILKQIDEKNIISAIISEN